MFRTKILIVVLIGLSLPAPIALAKRGEYAIGSQRDSHGRIQRSTSAKREFMRSNPCPATGIGKGPCPGYIVDHVVPLKRGGVDAPINMQWQTKDDAKAKDRWE